MVTKITESEYLQMYEVIGAAQEVHKELGRGLEEAIYQEAMEMELTDRGIHPDSQKVLNTYYKGRQLNKIYVADLYVDGIIVELKACNNIDTEHRAQLMNYMRITHQIRGLLINFGEKSLHVERYIYQHETNDFALLNEFNLNDYVTREKE